VVIINKVDTAYPEDIETVRYNISAVNPNAIVIEAASPIFVDDPSAIKGKKVVVVEDGPTLTHGEMSYGAGIVAATKFGAAEIVDPRPYAVGSIKEAYSKYTQLENLVPALGYSEKQLKELEETLSKIPADLVVIATPINLARVLKLNKPGVRVYYELQEIGTPTLENIVGEFIEKHIK
jgi:predicted GTPase